MSNHNYMSKLLFLISVICLASCDPGSPSGQTGFSVGGAAAPLSQAEYNSLTPEQQYQVASKLYGTLFRGITADEFFDLTNGVTALQPADTNFLVNTRNKLATNLSLDEVSVYDKAIDGLDEDLSNPDESLARYSFDTRSNLENNQRPRQIPLARIKDYPVSRDLYVNWMAYFMANTVQYSPAEEMESTDMQDVQRMFRFLFNNIKDRTSIRQMVGSNMSSLSRWRVSRTPQNHALEAFENYLGLFEDGNLTDEDKVLFPVLASLSTSIENAGLACRDLYLTRATDDYLIGQTDFPNTRPQLILEDSFVVNCADVYNVVAGHTLLIPRAVEVIINYFMPGQVQSEARLAVSEAIIAAGPETYEDIITAILFSREYLLNTHRAKSFEETFFSLLDSIKWDVASNVGRVGKGIFESMASDVRSDTYLGRMGWKGMSMKIGRLPSVPLDALSFAYYHKAIRDSFFIDTKSYRGGVNAAGEGLIFDENQALLPFIEGLKLDEFIDYLFLNTLHRRATAIEHAGLYDFFVNTRYYTNTINVDGVNIEVINSNSNSYVSIVQDSFDYISRLPELYYFTSVAQ